MDEDIRLRLTSGQTIGLAEYGDRGGRPWFYFHGWPSSRRQARMLDDVAAERGVRVIAPDRPGIGNSTFVPNRQLLDWPPLLKEIADALNLEKFAVLGVSGGGPYALMTAHSLAERLTAVGIICGAPPLRAFKKKTGLHPAYRVIYGVRKLAPWSMPPFLPLARRMAALPVDHTLMKVALRTIPKADRAALDDQEAYRAVALSFQDATSNGMRPLITDGDIYFSDWGFRLEEITCPLRFWHGERDSNIPLHMVEQTAARIPSATTRWFPNDGHYSLPVVHRAMILDELLAMEP